jgi:hypothetical protein
MKLTTRISLAALVLGLGCATISRSHHNQEKSTRVGLSSGGTAELPQQVAVPAGITVGEIQAGSQAAHAATSVTIAQALPGLSRPVTNWREFKPQKITIAPYPDTAFEFEVVSTSDADGRTVWTGRNSIQGAFLVTAATENDWHAVLSVPGGSSFEFHISGQTLTVAEQVDEMHCGMLGHAQPTPQAAPTTTASATTTTASTVAQAATIYTVDLLFFYDAATLAAANNNPTTISNTIAARVAAANLALQNSGVAMRWNYLTAVQICAYSNPTNDMAIDLQQIESMNMGGSHLTGTAKFTYDQCTLYGADQAVLYVSGSRNYAGLAYTLDSGGNPYHYSVVLWSYDFSVLAHELGHNFG